MKNKIYRFLEISFKNKITTLKLFTESSVNAIWYDVLPVVLLPLLTTHLQNGDFANAKFIIFISLLLCLFFWIINYFIRIWDYQGRIEYENYANNVYRKNLLIKNNLIMENYGTGLVQSIIQKGINSWVDLNWYFIYQLPRIVFGLITGVYLTMQMGLEYLIAFLIIAGLSVFSFTFLKQRQVKHTTEVNDIEDELNKNYIRTIMSRQEIIYADKVDYEVNVFSDYLKDILKKSKYPEQLDYLADLSVTSLSVLIPLIGAFYIIGYDQSNVGFFLALMYFSTKFANIMYWYVWIVNKIIDNYPQMTKLWRFIDKVPTIKNYERGKKFIHDKGEIELQNINFSYENYQVLKNFNLIIKGGSKVALVGGSGSGKSTIIKLITGYLTINESDKNTGKVLVDGQDLSTVSLKSFYKKIGYLTQDPMIFDGTIKENLLYALSSEQLINLTDEKLEEVMIKTQCEFIFDLADGLNTDIGEKGVKLSGGERQRLAIAKLFLKDPDIIILDEPTAALDSFSEEVISTSLEELSKGRTIITIAHRLQTVKNADEIIVLEDGEVVERGNHEQLIAKKGQYYEMLELQSGF